MTQITKLKDNEIFVFGSNLAGKHLGGAAKQAHEQFGAQMGVGEGLTGQCYAFPTLDTDFEKRSHQHLLASKDKLIETIVAHPDKVFLLTKVGCGIAGYREAYMQSLFKHYPPGLVLPEDWAVEGVINSILLDVENAIESLEEEQRNAFQKEFQARLTQLFTNY